MLRRFDVLVDVDDDGAGEAASLVVCDDGCSVADVRLRDDYSASWLA